MSERSNHLVSALKIVEGVEYDDINIGYVDEFEKPQYNSNIPLSRVTEEQFDENWDEIVDRVENSLKMDDWSTYIVARDILELSPEDAEERGDEVYRDAAELICSEYDLFISFVNPPRGIREGKNEEDLGDVSDFEKPDTPFSILVDSFLQGYNHKESRLGLYDYAVNFVRNNNTTINKLVKALSSLKYQGLANTILLGRKKDKNWIYRELF